jgi:hypothetical protein
VDAWIGSGNRATETEREMFLKLARRPCCLRSFRPLLFIKQRLVLTGYDEWSNSGLCLRGVACPELYLVNKELLVNPALTPSSYTLIKSCTSSYTYLSYAYRHDLFSVTTSSMPQSSTAQGPHFRF